MSQPETQYKLHPHARFRVLDGAGVFVLQESGEVLEVNAVGACIVESLRKNGRLSDAVAQVETRFEVGREIAERDAAEFVAMLIDADALSAVEM